MIKFLFRIHGSKKTIITTQKRTRRPISSHLARTSWDNKGFISWPKRYHFLAGPRRKMSKGKMGTSFRLRRVANQYTGFASYYRLMFSAMLIILKIAWVPCCWGCIALRDQLFNTQYKTLSESIKSLSCFNASGEFY